MTVLGAFRAPRQPIGAELLMFFGSEQALAGSPLASYELFRTSLGPFRGVFFGQLGIRGADREALPTN